MSKRRAAKPTVNHHDRYDLPVTRPRPSHAAVYPAPGSRVGIRNEFSHSRRFGSNWTPAVVEGVTERALLVRMPGTGWIVALWHWDACDIQLADQVTFWRRCKACRGTGASIMGGDPCSSCATLPYPATRCKECAGWGVVRGSTILVGCLECDGWIDLAYNPFEISRPNRHAGTT